MTKILAIDTTLGACSAAIIENAEVLAAMEEIRARGHVERLLPMIEEVREQADIHLSELDFIATTIGPGTFAGVRVGLSAAKGLGLALDIPLIPVTSLEAIICEFCSFNPDFNGEVAVAIDARRGEIYMQGFEVTKGDFISKHEPRALSIEQASGQLQSELVTIIGSGTSLLLKNGGLEITHYHNPTSEYVAKVAISKIPEAASCHDISPLYLRAPDAIKPSPLKMVILDD